MKVPDSDGRPESKPLVVFIVGPTAVGKSRLAMALAKQINGEIVSADSMQVYREMDIGTAKPTLAERRAVPHHLIDILSPRKNFSVYDYRRRALKAIRTITAAGRVPIVVGGSGLYVRSLSEGLSEQPGADNKIRKKYHQMAQAKGSEFLYRKLEKLNPGYAAGIKPTDEKRIVRALEIIAQSGRTVTQWYQRKQSLEELGFKPVMIGLNRERSEIYKAVEDRVDQMFRKGLVREVRRLMRKRLSKTASQALAYKEIIGVLKTSRGKSKKEMDLLIQAEVPIIKRNTRHFAKRQITWFKKEKGIRWVLWDSGNNLEDVCQKVMKEISRGPSDAA
ncbi:MAG: tRNA (adenosine(37)-N6)-dimethylallyltransferase MiaA [Candidatus Omnitrophica bacterium]|nr:tRNA (adenosine(37)-N6)-dimethylallyltransferase MiaA [Candidatus Omnitrophota bacterium]MDD5671289.1 tRNA (adenosine(37)-N6)-dimethylallyltransferase MiaA [Candidatus Omnitrophota bacterium]